MGAHSYPDESKPQRRKGDQPHASDWEHDPTALETVRSVLGTLISWMAQSANSPIRRDEADTLLKRLESIEGPK